MLQKSISQLNRRIVMSRMYSSANEYRSLNDALFYEPANPVQFKTDRLTVFDNDAVTEKRFAPFELKETTFKNVMGYAGTMVIDNMIPLGAFTYYAAAGWCINWAYNCWGLMSTSIRKIELHKDGKNVTLHPRMGRAFTVKISDIEKQQHEKTLVETYEEAFLFPI